MDILTQYGHPPKNHMQPLTDQELSIVFEYLTQHNQVDSIESIYADVYHEPKPAAKAQAPCPRQQKGGPLGRAPGPGQQAAAPRSSKQPPPQQGPARQQAPAAAVQPARHPHPRRRRWWTPARRPGGEPG